MSLLEYVEENNAPDAMVSQRVKKSVSKSKTVRPKISKLKSVKPKIDKSKTHRPKISKSKTSTQKTIKKPSILWYLLHVPFGFASGPLCHYLWDDVNAVEAERHLGYGIMLSAGMWIAVGVTLLVSFV